MVLLFHLSAVVYDAICYDATEAFHWIAVTMFIIVVLAMIMLTFRVAFMELDIPKDTAARSKELDESIVAKTGDDLPQRIDPNDWNTVNAETGTPQKIDPVDLDAAVSAKVESDTPQNDDPSEAQA